MEATLFSADFLESLKSLITQHHSLYDRLPPQGIFFESLVELAFRRSGWAQAKVVATNPNSPKHDLLVGDERLSLKTETGKATKAGSISITKLCTTETGLWTVQDLVDHVLRHLSRYDRMLMLRAVWRFVTNNKIKTLASFHYRLLEVPLDILKMISLASIAVVGKRPGDRKSLGGDVMRGSEVLFHVHFDGSDGKCQIRSLPVVKCTTLLEWDHPIRTSSTSETPANSSDADEHGVPPSTVGQQSDPS